ncbi:LPXTG cell wall anchor domain-containing protein [Staphylococcus caledonicus]|uniref:LPXTG cell wall anchor domain-containing protein n=1 Tax=Staphylococcus caledonicus TaxID=2741333 RepID=UPI0018E48B10|nr:LPXTG cell wall anchor domain-containing protein [Staphylococcus caledonicus]MBI5972553.1 LPXTG cell wall anchor domain-containing protein [Staphylococcus caledonicus]
MLKKNILVSTLMATVTTINLNNAHAAERNYSNGNINNATNGLDHGILHKDGTFTPPNVNPHYDILEVEDPIIPGDELNVKVKDSPTLVVEDPINPGDALNRNVTSNKANHTTDNKAVSNNNNGSNTTNYNKLNSNNAMNNDNSSNHYEAKANTQPNALTHSASVLPNTGVTQSNSLINVIAYSSIFIGLFLVYRNRIKQ